MTWYGFLRNKARAGISRIVRNEEGPLTTAVIPATDGSMLYFKRAIDYEISNAEMDNIVNKIVATNRAFKKYSVIFSPIPCKETIYQDLLKERRASSRIPELVTRLQRSDVEVVDITTPLLQKKRSGIPLSLSDDTHWNEYATSIGARELAKQIMNKLYAAHRLPRQADYSSAACSLLPNPSKRGQRAAGRIMRGRLFKLRSAMGLFAI